MAVGARTFHMKCGSEILYIDCEKDKIWDTPNID